MPSWLVFLRFMGGVPLSISIGSESIVTRLRGRSGYVDGDHKAQGRSEKVEVQVGGDQKPVPLCLTRVRLTLSGHVVGRTRLGISTP